jgi:hypothetical protein
MNARAIVRGLKAAMAALAGLFVDDGSLAMTLALLMVATGFAASTPWIGDELSGGAFAAALAAALIENVARAARAARMSRFHPHHPQGAPP